MAKLTQSERADYVRSHYALYQEEHSDLWIAVRFAVAGGADYGAELRGFDKADVIRRARANWGHFCFDDEARAFAEIFPPQR